jgi:hypothetical protein
MLLLLVEDDRDLAASVIILRVQYVIRSHRD